LEKVYAYEPVPAELSSEEGKYVMGAQANLWTEYIADESHAQRMVLPRMCALAEVLWTPKEKRNEAEFINRLMKHWEMLETREYNISTSIFNVSYSISPLKNGVHINFTPKVPGTIVRVRDFGNKTPKIRQMISYKGFKQTTSFDVRNPKNILVYFHYDFEKGGHGYGQGEVFEFLINRATAKKVGLPVKPNENYATDPFVLVNGICAPNERSKKEWMAWNKSETEMIIDLDTLEKIKRIKIHSFKDARRWIWLPEKAVVSFSQDGVNFENEKTFNLTMSEKSYSGSMKFKSRKTRFIKIHLYTKDKIPAGNPGEGQTPWIFLDEIEVY
jgi:hexosaminidase